MAAEHYALNNDPLVKDAMDFHRELGRNTWLPNGETYAVYSTELETINGLNFTTIPGSSAGTFRILENGDKTVTELSTYDLEGLIDESKMIPIPKFTRRFSGLEHTEIQWEPVVMRCVLGLIQ
jgi:hypothetical protein